MSHRAAELVAVLYRAGGQLETKDLAAKLHVGERSVRRYISAANDELAGIASIEHDHGRGYILSISDRQEFSSYLKDAEAAAARSGTRAERVSYLINDLLSRSDWVTLDTLSDILFVSRRTISSDLRDVAHSLSRFNLSLESKPYRGIRVVGAEMDKRLCLANTAFQEVLDAQGVDACGVTVENIASCIEDALDAHGVTMSSTGYHNLFVHIAVAIVRIKANQYVPMESESLESIRHVPSFSVAQEIVASLERRFDMTFPVEEVAYIALHLAGKQVSFDGGTDVDSQPIISDEIWSIVAEMVEAVWQAYRFDLRNDLELRMNLARHVAPLAVRMQYHMRVDNPLMEDIQARFPLAWSMAVDASRVLERAFDSSLDNAEIGYIALAFALAIERSSERPYKKRILVVCASGAGSARLLEYRCHQEFGAYLESVQACDVSMVGNVDFSRIDYVFTTVPLPIEVPVPVREVGVFLDSADVKGIIELFKKPSGGGVAQIFPSGAVLPPYDAIRSSFRAGRDD